MKNLILICLLTFLACKTGQKGVNKIDPDCIDVNRVELRTCVDEVLPVCGCDGKTYTNACVAWNAKVKTWKSGPCPPEDCIDESKINPDLACAAVFAPVCGCDGKIYPNACEAQKKGVTSWVDGDCNQ